MLVVLRQSTRGQAPAAFADISAHALGLRPLARAPQHGGKRPVRFRWFRSPRSARRCEGYRRRGGADSRNRAPPRLARFSARGPIEYRSAASVRRPGSRRPAQRAHQDSSARRHVQPVVLKHLVQRRQVAGLHRLKEAPGRLALRPGRRRRRRIFSSWIPRRQLPAPLPEPPGGCIRSIAQRPPHFRSGTW